MKPDSGPGNHGRNHKARQLHIHLRQIPGIDASPNNFSNNPVIGVPEIDDFFSFLGREIVEGDIKKQLGGPPVTQRHFQMTFNNESQLLNGAGIRFLFHVLNRINDLFHFFPKYFEKDFFFVSEEIIDIGGSAAIGNAYVAHTRGLVALFPEQPSRYFKHLGFLKTGFAFASRHENQTISVEGLEIHYINERPLIYYTNFKLVKQKKSNGLSPLGREEG
jgi:hypothetical protein